MVPAADDELGPAEVLRQSPAPTNKRPRPQTPSQVDGQRPTQRAKDTSTPDEPPSSPSVQAGLSKKTTVVSAWDDEIDWDLDRVEILRESRRRFKEARKTNVPPPAVKATATGWAPPYPHLAALFGAMGLQLIGLAAALGVAPSPLAAHPGAAAPTLPQPSARSRRHLWHPPHHYDAAQGGGANCASHGLDPGAATSKCRRSPQTRHISCVQPRCRRRRRRVAALRALVHTHQALRVDQGNDGGGTYTNKNIIYGRFGLRNGRWVTFHGGQAGDGLSRGLWHDLDTLKLKINGESESASYHQQQACLNDENVAFELLHITGLTDRDEAAECLSVWEAVIDIFFGGYCLDENWQISRAAYGQLQLGVVKGINGTRMPGSRHDAMDKAISTGLSALTTKTTEGQQLVYGPKHYERVALLLLGIATTNIAKAAALLIRTWPVPASGLKLENLGAHRCPDRTCCVL